MFSSTSLSGTGIVVLLLLPSRLSGVGSGVSLPCASGVGAGQLFWRDESKRGGVEVPSVLGSRTSFDEHGPAGSFLVKTSPVEAFSF